MGYDGDAYMMEGWVHDGSYDGAAKDLLEYTMALDARIHELWIWIQNEHTWMENGEQ